jgi:hypothetical protein
MIKKLLLLITLITVSATPFIHANKFVIGCEGAGFFSIFITALNHFAWCERNKRTPVVYWDWQCLYYQKTGYNNTFNAWEYYFEPVSQLRYQAGDQITRGFYALDGTSIPYLPFNVNVFEEWKQSLKPFNALIQKYVKIKPPINHKINNFYNLYMRGKKTIGIHIRGTDKHLEKQIVPVSLDVIIAQANKYSDYQFFIATDEHRLLEEAKKKLNGKVISYNAVRSVDGSPIHYDARVSHPLRGEEVLIESQLLSKCDLIIHTCSNVSLCAYYFNPNLKGILLTHNKNFFINL